METWTISCAISALLANRQAQPSLLAEPRSILAGHMLVSGLVFPYLCHLVTMTLSSSCRTLRQLLRGQ